MRSSILAAAGGLAVIAVLAPAVPAQAASAIQIHRVYYDSPGSDNRSNSSLNAEWVQIKNVSKSRRSLTGWKLRDKSGHTYTFGTFNLSAGKTVTVHTGRGTNSSTHRYWGSRAYIWNNTGDTAYLRTSSGSLADSCSWKSSGSSKYC